MTSTSNSSHSTHPTGRVLWEELLVLSRFLWLLRAEFLSPVNVFLIKIIFSGVKLYGCPLCKYESRFSQNIRSHHQIHMNVKPWICDVCGSAFVSKCNLRHHMVSHSTDRPFKCSICGVGFKQKVVLQQHVARHNEDRQFVCDHCGKGIVLLTLTAKRD